MAKALNEVMPNTYYELCTWHIMQNEIKHLENLMKNGYSFQVFKTCMFDFNVEIKFEKTWEDMKRPREKTIGRLIHSPTSIFLH